LRIGENWRGAEPPETGNGPSAVESAIRNGIVMRRRRLVLGCASLLVFVAGWEVAFSTVVRWDPFFITKPSLIAAAFREQLLGGGLWGDLAVSAQSFVAGFALAVIVGIPVGAVMGWRRRAEYALDRRRSSSSCWRSSPSSSTPLPGSGARTRC
jgi:hypothetical protein